MMSTPVNDVNSQYSFPQPASMNNSTASLQCNVSPDNPGSNNPPAYPIWNTYMASQSINTPNAYPAANVSSTAHPWNVLPGTSMFQNIDPPLFYQTFLKVKPKALGILLIAVALVQVTLGGVMFAFNISVPGFIPYWGAMFYALAGTMTIKAQVKPNISLVKYSLVTNIVASIVSLLTIILTCLVYPIIYCDYYGTYFEEEYQKCMKKRSGSYGMLSIFLILHILFFCVSNSISVFSCRALEHSKINVPQVFVLPSAGLVPAPPTVFETISPAPPQAPPPPYTVQEETKGDLRMM